MRGPVDRALAFEPRTVTLGACRTILAVAELSVLLFTSDADLFPGERAEPRCDGLRALSLWCAGSGDGALTLSRIIAIAVLVLAASGYRPRWTCIPHWYVTFSLGAAIHVPNGGENVARIVTLLLIPICLGDDRIWQWVRPNAPLRAAWRGNAYIAHLVIRAQIVIIYGEAVWTKIRESEWRDGSALHHVFQDAYFGARPELAAFLESGIFTNWSIPAFTWGTIALESAIVVCAFGNANFRRIALVLGVVLHGGIIIGLGLFSFGLVMIGLLAAATSGPPVPSGGNDQDEQAEQVSTPPR